jgi:serine/threonine protein kinase
MVQATYEWAYSLGSGSSNHITVVRKGMEIDQNNVSPGSSRLTFALMIRLLHADYILSLLRQYAASSIAPTQLAVLMTSKPDTTGMNRAELRQEARILATLRHPYIVAYVAQTTRPTPGVLVQYCAGGSLRDRIRWHQVHRYVSSPCSHRRCRSSRRTDLSTSPGSSLW